MAAKTSSSLEPLPILPFLPEIAALLAERGALVLAAEPGAGKTSLVPPALARALPGKILVTEPRRLAAIAAAARMAELEGLALGDRVGYRVKGESKAGPATRIEVVTEGILVRMVQDDPSLSGVGAVVFDEIHERSLFADLCLALVSEARALRPDLRVLAMSATLDVEALSAFLGAAVLRVPGASHPVETRHDPIADGPGFEAGLAARALALSEETEGDVLVFLPGAAEIARAERELAAQSSVRRGLEVISLLGSQSLAVQKRALAPDPAAPRRIVLATSVAETSLTVPRVRAVVDSGLARLSRYHPRTGLNRLVTEREARDRADQRRGRSGRLGPGICLRAWPATDALSERTEPEISRSELSGLALESAAWGARGRLGLPWLSPPPPAAWEGACELLRWLGALDAGGSATARGKAMVSLGVEPRLAALVLTGVSLGASELACAVAALLGERDATGERNLEERLSLLRGGSGYGTSGGELGRPRAEARRLEAAAARAMPRLGPSAPPTVGAAAAPSGPPALGPLLALAYPDRVARREGLGPRFRLPSGRALRAPPALAVSEWIVAVEADAGAAEGKVFSGAPIAETDALRALEPIVAETLEIEWLGVGFRARRVRRAGGIVLFSAPAPAPGRAEIAELLCARVAREGLAILPWGEAGAGAFLERLRWWAGHRSASRGSGESSTGALPDAVLAATAADWLAPYVSGDAGGAIDGASLKRALESLLGEGERAAFRAQAPERLELPSGSSRPIDYGRPGGPAVEAKVQEFFGLGTHPAVAGRPIVLSLLDPGGKPLQVTADLPGFWRGAWAQARKELRGRYPKHDWPEDPASATPSRSGIKRRR